MSKLATLREMLSGAPLEPGPVADGLKGWRAPDDQADASGFPLEICWRCAGRIMARGCGFALKDWTPLWEGDPGEVDCATCEPAPVLREPEPVLIDLSCLEDILLREPCIDNTSVPALMQIIRRNVQGDAQVQLSASQQDAEGYMRAAWTVSRRPEPKGWTAKPCALTHKPERTFKTEKAALKYLQDLKVPALGYDARYQKLELRTLIANLIAGVRVEKNRLWVCLDGTCVLRVQAPQVDVDIP